MPQDVAAALGSLPLNYDVELEYLQAEYTIDMALPSWLWKPMGHYTS